MDDYDIAQIYRDMELYIIRSMKKNLGKHLKDEIAEGFQWKMWQAEKLKELKRFQKENKKIINFYTKNLDKEVADILRYEFKKGSKDQIKLYNDLFDKNMSDSFFKINNRKVNALIRSVNNDFNKANKACLRMTNDVYRQTVHRAAMFANNGVMTQKQAVDMAMKDFLSRGLNVIEYKNGARVNIAAYSQMAVRTASQRAMLIGEGEFRKEIGETLVIISKHNTSCKICQPHEKKIYIDDVYSGGIPDGKHKLLSEAMEQGLFHPNCRHGINTYYDIDGIKREQRDDAVSEVPPDNDNAELNSIDRKIEMEKRRIAGYQDPTNIKNSKDKLKELEVEKEIITNEPKVLTKDEKDAVEYYVSGEGMYINSVLQGRNEFITMQTLDDTEKKLIKNLDSALTDTIKEKTLYRSVDIKAIFGDLELNNEYIIDGLKYGVDDTRHIARNIRPKLEQVLEKINNTIGKNITEKGYLSTSKDYSIVRDWGSFTGSENPIVIEFTPSKNTKGRDLFDFDIEGEEQREVLLARNQTYTIEDVELKDDKIYVKAKFNKIRG